MLVILLILILLGSTFGIIVNSFDNSGTNNKVKYNGYEFTNSNGLWVTNYNEINLGFIYNPLETENLSLEMDFSDSVNQYSGVPLYIYSEDSSARLEIYRNLYSIAERIQDACPQGKNCTGDVPSKSCDDKLIIIEESDKEEILQENGCIYIHGDKDNLVKISDEFLYKLFSIK